MSTKLTVIVDNIPHGGMRSEWGLSILAEYKDNKNGEILINKEDHGTKTTHDPLNMNKPVSRRKNSNP